MSYVQVCWESWHQCLSTDPTTEEKVEFANSRDAEIRFFDEKQMMRVKRMDSSQAEFIPYSRIYSILEDN